MRPVAVCAAVLVGVISAAAADEPPTLESSPLAQAFGAPPLMWGLNLSPDGTKIVFVQLVPEGVTIARVLDLNTKKTAVVLTGKQREFDVSWCDWASNSRLLCGVRGVVELYGKQLIAATRLIAVNADGSKMKVVLQRKADEYTQFQDRVIDWLPDEPGSVLVQLPSPTGSGVARLNIETGELKTESRIREGVHSWISDGYGAPRLYEIVTSTERRWLVRDTPDAAWTVLHEARLEDLEDEFSPIGFGENRNELLYYGVNDGRTALFALDLEHGHKSRIVYSHATLDVDDVLALGKHRRLVAASYYDDRPHLHFFDARIERLQKALDKYFTGKAVSVIDEDWSQRYYLLFVGSDTDAGSYYRFDAEKLVLELIVHAYPSLGERKLAPMRAIRYPADDGVEIPGYLTLPLEHGAGPLPAIVLPHGGPSSRDYWNYDFLVQYLVANGYAVLQSNYRGSDGYGRKWLGEGGFRGWPRAIADIAAGADYLVRLGIADANRLCTVGWSYGGYAALMSAIEQPKKYRCVASIAGVTDPGELSRSEMRFIGGSRALAFIGAGDPEVRKAGSPSTRAKEIQVPVLLAHAKQDLNVPFAQSADFAKALKRSQKDVEFIEYDYAEHDIRPERYRVDLLTRLGAFLEMHLAGKAER